MQDDAKIGVLDLQTESVQTLKVPGMFLEAYYGMSWSPDGKFVVTTVVDPKPGAGSFSLWKLSLPSGNWHKLATLPDDLCQRGLVSPKGQTVLFRDAHSMNLNLLDLDTGNKVALTDTGDTYRLGYAWSPDATRIYFSRGYMAEQGGLWIMQADGSNKQQVSNEQEPRSLAVSPKERHIAYTVSPTNAESRASLFVATLPDLQTTGLSSNANWYFQWHPKKEELLFQEDTSVKVWSVHHLNESRNSVNSITNADFPIWTEQGASIVFVRDRTHLWRYDIDAKAFQQMYSIKE